MELSRFQQKLRHFLLNLFKFSELKYSFFLFMLFCALLLTAQQKVQILDKQTGFPVPSVEVKSLNDQLLSVSDQNGFFDLKNDTGEIFIDHPGYPPQFFSVSDETKQIFLLQDMVNLRTLEIKSNDDKSLNLVRKVIANQAQNSPKSRENYRLKSYTKLWADADSDSIQFIPNPKTKADSAQNKSKELLTNSMFFLSERAITHYYDRRKGEKNVVEAAKISGLQTPMYELVALQPISVEFNQNEFDFFFRKFPNPFSRGGMKSYNFIIADTLTQNGRQMILLNFNSKKEKKRSLHGTALIDAQTFALSRFHAENQTQLGSDAYIEVLYRPKKNVWIPEYQTVRIESDNVRTHVYRDSITPEGEKVQQKIERKSRSWMNIDTRFSGFESPTELGEDLFQGLANEVPRQAFTDFDNRIQEFRTEDLNLRESETYITIDSIGKAEKVDRMVKIFRILSSEGWLSLGPIDFDLKEIYSGNAWEDFRFGISTRTNHKFHPKLSLNGRVYYGTRDNAFKYGAGAEYMLFPERQGKVFVDYSDDIAPAGRFKHPVYTFEEAFMWFSEQSANPFFVDENRFSGGYQQDFFENLTARLTLSQTPQTAMFDYSFDGNAIDTEYGLTNLQLAVRYAPQEASVVSPIGKFRIKRSKPVYKLLIDQGLSVFGGEQEFTRVNLNADFAWNFFSKPTFFNLRAGKVFGDVPVWNYFDGGGKSRIHDGFWQRMRFGGTQIFETMMPGEFISDQYAFISAKQQFINLKFSKNYSIPVSAVYKIGMGSFENFDLHDGLNFNELNKPYQEAGLEFSGILMNLVGIGVYYRLGAYQFDQFDRNLSVKAVLNLRNF